MDPTSFRYLATGRFLGIRDEDLQGAWDIDAIATWVGIGHTKARALMHAADAPPPLRTGSLRCDRWSPHLVLAWLHGLDWRDLLDMSTSVDMSETSPASPATDTGPGPQSIAAPPLGRPGTAWTPPQPGPLDTPDHRRRR